MTTIAIRVTHVVVLSVLLVNRAETKLNGVGTVVSELVFVISGLEHHNPNLPNFSVIETVIIF